MIYVYIYICIYIYIYNRIYIYIIIYHKSNQKSSKSSKSPSFSGPLSRYAHTLGHGVEAFMLLGRRVGKAPSEKGHPRGVQSSSIPKNNYFK